MRGFAAAAVFLGSALLGPSVSAEHLLDRAAVEAVLTEKAEERHADLAALDRFLATPPAERAVRSMGADPTRARAALASLSDAELHDLAQRAAALQVDPVAGLTGDVNTLLVVFLIVAIVILVLSAV